MSRFSSLLGQCPTPGCIDKISDTRKPRKLRRLPPPRVRVRAQEHRHKSRIMVSESFHLETLQVVPFLPTVGVWTDGVLTNHALTDTITSMAMAQRSGGQRPPVRQRGWRNAGRSQQTRPVGRLQGLGRWWRRRWRQVLRRQRWPVACGRCGRTHHRRRSVEHGLKSSGHRPAQNVRDAVRRGPRRETAVSAAGHGRRCGGQLQRLEFGRSRRHVVQRGQRSRQKRIHEQWQVRLGCQKEEHGGEFCETSLEPVWRHFSLPQTRISLAQGDDG